MAEEMSLVDHCRKFIPGYKLGNCWIAATAEDSMTKARAVIEEWKAKYHWEYPMRITVIKTSNFIVYSTGRAERRVNAILTTNA